ncbi:MAG: PD40 domain-containing protein [Bacteroidales bacterium]|nr:PD40 domain-containing protein [Bacteroidales bacterium]
MNTSLLRTANLIFVVLFVSQLFCQEIINPKETFVEAESYFLFEEYKDALPLYQKLLRLDPGNHNLLYKVGICYLNDPYQKEKSIRYLLDASKSIGKTYKSNNFKERNAPVEVNYYLGQAYRINKQFDKALEHYALFKNDLDPVVFDVEVVNDEIASCQVAKKMITSPVYTSKNNFGAEINSRFADFNAVLSGDGNTLVFTRELQFYDGVFISVKDNNGKWAPPYNLTSDFGLDGNSYSTGISFNGDEIFVYRSDNFDGNIYSSKFENGRWQPLKKLNGNINTKFWESHASPSPDGQYLFFTSNRKGGYGGLDIYKSPRLSNGEWGPAINLGPIINSRYNDDTPFLSPDNSKLFFSSLGHNGMGGYDLFVSEMISPSSWSRPVNMGFPLNTPDDDLFFCPVAGDKATGIYTAYDENTSYGLMDIYYFKVFNSVLPRPFTIAGKITVPSEKLLEDGQIKVTIIDSKQGKIIEQVSVDKSGNFILKANQGEYQLLVDGEGIKPVTLPLKLILTQENSIIDLPLITTQVAEVGGDIMITSAPVQPRLEIEGKKYIETDQAVVPINITAKAGNTLEIQNYINGKPAPKVEIILPDDKYTYMFEPGPGDNHLVFTLRDKNGMINQQELTVYYKPYPEIPPLTEEVSSSPTQLSDIAGFAEGKLKDYLNSLEALEYNSLADLYEMLAANALNNGYTQEQAEKLIALLLAQRSKVEFMSDVHSNQNLKYYFDNDSLIKPINIPLLIVQSVKLGHLPESMVIEQHLTDIVPFTGSPDGLFEYILSFVDDKPFLTKPEDLSNIYYSLSQVLEPQQLTSAIDISATSENPDQLYYNLLVSADGNYRKMLSGLNFEKLNIQNSVDIIGHIFAEAPKHGLNIPEVIRFIENARSSERQNLINFKEMLAEAASGGLKAHLQDFDINAVSGNNAYAGIIEALLRDSRSKGYNKSEVYDLLVELIGIKNIDDFIACMRKYTSGDLDSLLAGIDKNRFSKPIELIQYLLSEVPYYDFSDSDINNLLLRMLLENGLTGHEVGKSAGYSRELIKKRRMVTTVVFANVLLILIFILLWRRKKKKEKAQND